MPWKRERQPTPVLLLGEFHGQRMWQTTVHGIAKSWTQLCDKLSFPPFLWGSKDNHETIKSNVWFFFFHKYPVFISAICIERICVEIKENTGDDSITGPDSYSDKKYHVVCLVTKTCRTLQPHGL